MIFIILTVKCAEFQKHSQGTSSVHVWSSKSLTAKQAFDSLGYRVNIILHERTFFAENFLENGHKNYAIIYLITKLHRNICLYIDNIRTQSQRNSYIQDNNNNNNNNNNFILSPKIP